jgi:predicted transposase YbfD/YdcC
MIMENALFTIQKHFAPLKDPRMLKKTSHKLIDIIVIAICAVICGADAWTQVEEFGKARLHWFKSFLELPHGIPSHNTFGRIFSLISSTLFQTCFQRWINEVFEITGGQVIPIDGKTVRRSYDKKSDKTAIHMVHAWASQNGVLLGQIKTKEKSNEITAIPELLKLLEIKGCIITIDAMGCQRNIAEEIVDKKADYILAVKGNQEKLEEAIKSTFADAIEKDFEDMKYSTNKTVDDKHGRTEVRICYVLPILYLLGIDEFKNKWKGLKSIILLISERTVGGKTTVEHRFYISSLKASAKKISDAIRKHWSIENSLHWSLDVAFKEDQSRIRIGQAAENFSLLRKIALMYLKNETSLKGGIQTKRLRAGWDSEYLLKVLSA